MRTSASVLLVALVATAILHPILHPARAAAQNDVEGFSLNRFDPSERGSEWFVLDTLDFRGRFRGAAGAVADYAYKPLVFYDQNGKEAAALVEHQLFLHLGASISFVNRLRLAANLPVAALVKGSEGMIDGQQYSVAEGGQLGDLRISADVRLFGKYRGLASMSLGASVWAPTGSRDAYTGDGKWRVSPHLNLAGQVALFAYAAKVGFNVRMQDDELADVKLGNEIFGGLSLGVRVLGGRLLFGPELYFSTVVQDGAFKKETTPFEGLIGFHTCIAEQLRLGAAIGPGFTKGYGSPKVRALLSLEWSPCAEDKPPPGDRDHDGIIDPEDACPDEPGVADPDPTKNGCPIRDRDHDGILDPVDACPDEPGVANEDPKKHGCPLHDRDKDGILDEVDACPDLPGLASSDPEKNGCPDTDSDGIIDPKDACPNVAGPPNEDPTKHGCPLARIEKGQIRILEQVKFKTDSAEILGESDELMNAVMAILDAHPEITKISIEGHTDNVGNAKYNKKLSEKRAASVAKWLTDHHIEASRLSSAGFGLEAPIADNDTEEGRRINRRVEFHIRQINHESVDASGEKVEP